MKVPCALLFLIVPLVVWGEPKVLVDAIPTGATFAGLTPIRLPFKDAAKEDPEKIAEGLNGALGQILPAATSRGFSYICLVSAPGDKPVAIPIVAAKSNLMLRGTNSMVLAVFYRGGHEATSKTTYSPGIPEKKTGSVSATVEKVALPEGVNTAGWVYLNLTRIQEEAEKAKSPTVFVSAGGTGTVTEVPIPGMKEPLMVPEEKSTFTATWRMDPNMAANHKGEILGQPTPSDVIDKK